MKELTGLNEKLSVFVEGQDEKDIARARENMPTFRNLFRNTLALTRLGNKEKAVVAYDLCDTLNTDADAVILEDEEIAILRQAIETNPMELTNHLWAQLLKKVQAAKPTKRPESEKLPEGAIPLNIK